MKNTVPTGWRGVMNHRPQPSDFGLSPLADNVDAITQRQRVRIPRISHGIGGGMQVHDESDMHRLTFTQRGAFAAARKVSLTSGRAMFGLYASALMALLLIVHVHLRFTIHDLNMQQHALQTVERRLQRQSNYLDQQMISRVDQHSMKRYAVNQLGMVPNSDNNGEVVITAEAREKYSATAVAQVQQKRKAGQSTTAKASTSGRLWKLADMAIAYAQPKD